MVYPTSNANLTTSFSGATAQSGVHAQHHDAAATEINAIETDLLVGGALRTTIDGKLAATGGSASHLGIADYEDLTDLGADPASPAAGVHRMYAKAGGVYVKNSAGAVVGALGTGGGGATGLIFSASAYGVVGDNNNATAAANGTALNNCIAAAHSAGDGSIVALDWAGIAYLPGSHLIYSRIQYVGNGFNTSKLQNSAAAGTNVWQTASFSTITQTVHDYTMGEFEFQFFDHIIDGNKANNASGGRGLAIAGYGYRLDNLYIQNCKQTGWWSEWNATGEPSGGSSSLHQRAFKVGRVWCVNNDCVAVPAANTRSSQARASLTSAGAAIYGPGDSSIDYVEVYKDGSVAGNGLYFGTMDFTAGTFNAFSCVMGIVVVWLNHATAVYLGADGPRIGYLHAEGANTNLQIACQGPFINSGRCFFTQGSGTSVKVTSGGNGGRIHLNLENDSSASVTKLDSSGGSLQEAELDIYMDFGSAVAVTATAGTFPTNPRTMDITANNWGGATVTAGWLPLELGSTTLYGVSFQRKAALSLTGVGYQTGAGGTVTQATSKSTGVTLNTLSGAITMSAASLAASTSVSFTVTNSKVAATDVVIVSIKSGATANSYHVGVDAVAAGSFNVQLRNVSGGALAEAVVVNFVVIKGVNS